MSRFVEEHQVGIGGGVCIMCHRCVLHKIQACENDIMINFDQDLGARQCLEDKSQMEHTKPILCKRKIQGRIPRGFDG